MIMQITWTDLVAECIDLANRCKSLNRDEIKEELERILSLEKNGYDD